MKTLSEMAEGIERIETMLHQNTTIPVDMTQKQAAEVLHVSRWTVARYISRGQLRQNRRGRVTAESVRKLIS